MHTNDLFMKDTPDPIYLENVNRKSDSVEFIIHMPSSKYDIVIPFVFSVDRLENFLNQAKNNEFTQIKFRDISLTYYVSRSRIYTAPGGVPIHINLSESTTRLLLDKLTKMLNDIKPRGY